MAVMNYQTIRVQIRGTFCFIQFHRPGAGNSIDDVLVNEFRDALDECRTSITAVILEGLPDVFCMGADFESIHRSSSTGRPMSGNAAILYDLWLRLATGPYVTIAHVKGKANAGGVGFVAACDIVLASPTAQFSLSELLFGIFPACVLPFLVRRTGFQKANYLTLMTRPVTATEARDWGLVDAVDTDSDALLRTHLLRIRRLSKTAIGQYKSYMASLNPSLSTARPSAIAANEKIFSDDNNLAAISRYVETGQFPWE